MSDGRVSQNDPVESVKKLSAPLEKDVLLVVIFGIIRVPHFHAPSCPLLSILLFQSIRLFSHPSLPHAYKRDHPGVLSLYVNDRDYRKEQEGGSASRWCVRYGFMYFFFAGKYSKVVL